MGRRNKKISLKGTVAVVILSLIFSTEAAAASNDALSSGMISGNSEAFSMEADSDAAAPFMETISDDAAPSMEAGSDIVSPSMEAGLDVATPSMAKKEDDGESPAVPEEKRDVVSQTITEESAISVKYPIAAGTEGSPFDFLLDPCGLVDKTEAMRYGDGCVEEGATLLFYNRDGEYDFSKESDKLTVLTQEPAEITVSAYLSELGELEVMEDRDFSGSDVCGMYLALVDDRGNEQPLSADGEVSLSLSLEPGSYSFGLTGACNPDADWQDLTIQPKVTVTWCVESAMNEEDIFFWDEAVVDEEEEAEDTASSDEGEKESGKEGDSMGEPVKEEGAPNAGGPDKVSGPEEPGGSAEATVPKSEGTEGISDMNQSGEDRPSGEEGAASGADVPEPDSPEPDVPEPNSPEPDGREPDSPEPDAPEPDTPGPDSSEPDSLEPGSSEPDRSEGLGEESISSVVEEDAPDAAEAASGDMDNQGNENNTEET